MKPGLNIGVKYSLKSQFVAYGIGYLCGYVSRLTTFVFHDYVSRHTFAISIVHPELREHASRQAHHIDITTIIHLTQTL